MLQSNIDIGGNDHLWLNKPELPAANEENLKLDETVKDDFFFYLNIFENFSFYLNTFYFLK